MSPAVTQNSLHLAGALAGGVVGYAVSYYAGPMLVIPGIAALVLALLLTKTPLKSEHFAACLAITGGHFIWFVVAATLAGVWWGVALDVIGMGVALIWLWSRPGWIPVVFLALLQVVGLLVNGLSLVDVEPGTLEHKALTVHCVFRAVSLITLLSGYIQLRRSTSRPAEQFAEVCSEIHTQERHGVR